MVKIAIAGGTGQVAREIIDALVASGKHEITIFSRGVRMNASIGTVPTKLTEDFRQNKAPDGLPSSTKWQTVDYTNKNSLVQVLQGIHTLLSFVQLLSDPNQESQKNLIDAAILAGVKRFAPSEYGSKGTTDMGWWDGKQRIREYLEEVNRIEKVLEYTLFQPGLFLDYMAYPYKTAKHIEPLQIGFNFERYRAMAVEGHEDAIMTLTTAADLAAIVACAVDYEGTWPNTGGIRGNRFTFSEIIEIGERVRGRPFDVGEVKLEDLEAGELKSSWNLEAVHSAVSQDQESAFQKAVSIGFLLSSIKGAWDSSDEMNQMFPDYKFTSAEMFLKKVWEGKP
ncbi:NAD(P)-binding protein [Apiospora phragmitis]|uniref:NAD(P)-binding protein n=1 Tax=Apiospora phragmitis TaxID=2905665 RepID=A0ABR1T3B6_9PEZI